MLRTNSARTSGAVYREVLNSAFAVAWRERRYWLLALFASLLLTAGSYDILLRIVSGITVQGSMFISGGASTASVSLGGVVSDVATFMNALTALQVVLLLTIILASIAAFSCVCQAALVYAIGSAHRNKRPSLGDTLRVGGLAFWPVATMNALVIAVSWVLRFLVAVPLFLALVSTTQQAFLLYLVSFIVFVPLAFFISIIQIFALNALVLQGAPIADAIIRGFTVVKKHWVAVIETALLLFLISIGIAAIYAGACFIFLMPVIVGIATAAVFASTGLFYAILGATLALFIACTIIAVAFTTQLQYAAWSLLYRKLGEGGAVPKIHRWIRSVFGILAIPQ